MTLLAELKSASKWLNKVTREFSEFGMKINVKTTNETCISRKK